jgi:hypothetical protein
VRWLSLLLVLAVLFGCPAPSRYAVERAGLGCDRATRVAYRTLTTMGYTVTNLVPASPAQRGVLTATKPSAEGGEATSVRVLVSCDGQGAVLQPVEEGLAPNYDFSRGFGYSFTTLVQRPDVETPQAAVGLQVRVEALTPQEGLLDLGAVPTIGGAVLVRVTIRNETDRAVAVDPARIELVPADGASATALSGGALAAALAPGGAGERVRAEQLRKARIAPHTTATGFLVYPPGTYREARIGIEDVETEEAEGFVTPVE